MKKLVISSYVEIRSRSVNFRRTIFGISWGDFYKNSTRQRSLNYRGNCFLLLMIYYLI